MFFKKYFNLKATKSKNKSIIFIKMISKNVKKSQIFGKILESKEKKS
jgi:hypothetical protein